MPFNPEPHVRIQTLITAVNNIPDPQARFFGMLGLARALPHDEFETVELDLVPAMGELAQVEGLIPRAKFSGHDGTHVEVDRNEQVPRTEFYGLLATIAAWEDPALREAALVHVINMIVSTADWVAW